ncbi:hypothetical protein LTR53_003133 [Teratosphaeriaceae sp. CCFEE 6253]|nr:hypothetical protein LTR53_003133 [Teratosphaeriaceae sp. CCFEE 6253]
MTSHTRHASTASKSGHAPHANIKAAHHHAPPRHVALPAAADYDTSLSIEARKYLKTYGLTPPGVDTYEKQNERALAILNSRKTPIEKYQYLSILRSTNVHLFYRLLSKNVKELTPLIYTPTVGEACQRWSELYTQPEGLYLSFEDRGHLHTVIQNWPHHDVDITVVTDGSRILGLGDLGINGMGIPVGKLSLYTACAGIDPMRTLPLCLDLGTSNEKFRNDPLYMGSRRDKVTAEEEKDFLDELMAALTERWPGIVIQYEDFKNPFPSLERYQETYTMFNDDIQGTGAVILGGFINGVKQSRVAPPDQRAVFLGAGSAGVGVAKQLTEFFMKEGLSEDEAKKRFWLVDSQGLVTMDRPGKLAEHKVYFARDDNDGKQFKTLEEIVDKSECTFEEAIKYTKGKCLFASGSPFPTLNYEGKDLVPGQGNNMYIFSGLGLGTILSKAVNVTQGMVYASGEALSTSLLPEEIKENWLYPDIRRIRDVSVTVACGVIRAAQADRVDRELSLRNISDEELEEFIRNRMYDPYTEHDKVNEELRELAQHVMGSPTQGQGQGNGLNRKMASRPGTANGEAYRAEEYDPKILEEMGELGLLGATIQGYDCAGVSSVASGLITRAVERVDSGYRSGQSVQSSLVMGGIDEFGSKEQKEKFLPGMAKGKILGCFGLTEPNHGSDPGSMESMAKPHPTKKGYYSLSGSKTWITNSPIADVLLVWAKLQETDKIRGFLVERDQCPPGTLSTPKLPHKNGLRASITGMIQMDEVPVAHEMMFPDVEGLRGPFSCLNNARFGIAWGTIGALEDCIARARTYSLERRQFKNNPIAKYQLVQKKLADATTDAAFGIAAALQVGRLKDEGKIAPEMISMIKRQNCDRALVNARTLQEIFGGNAVSDEYHIGRHVSNLFVTQTYEGQSDIHALILGRAITGIQAFV